MRIIDDHTIGICDNQKIKRKIADLSDRCGDAGGGECIQTTDFIGHELGFFNHGTLFALIKKLLAILRAINIQKQQDKTSDDDKTQSKTKLCAAVWPKFWPIIS